jgi:hypothetical protein
MLAYNNSRCNEWFDHDSRIFPLLVPAKDSFGSPIGWRRNAITATPTLFQSRCDPIADQLKRGRLKVPHVHLQDA